MARTTVRRREYLRTIARLTRAHGYPPTLREIGDALGVTKAAVQEIVAKMRAQGDVAYEDRETRTIRVVRRAA